MPLPPLGEMREGSKESGKKKSGLTRLRSILKRVRAPNLMAGMALFFSAFLFFSDLFTDRFILTERDLAPYFIPPRFFWVESLKNGNFPLWNPYQFTGHPFLANPQHAILYPLNLLFFVLPFDVAFNIIIILHFFLAGFFTYLLLKELRAGTLSSLLSGSIFMLSGYLLSIHSLLNSLLSVVWTPLIIIFFRRALALPGLLKNEILTALFMTISFLGGGVEIVYGNFLILFLMLIHPPLPKLPSENLLGQVGRRIKVFVLTFLSFLLFSAVQLFPFLELYAQSIRGQGISFSEATIWSFAPRDFLLFFLPDAYGYFLDTQKYWTSQCWLKTLYTGGLPFLLIFFFFLRPGYRRFYLALIILSFCLAPGHYNPLYPFIFKYLPFFSGIRYPVKFLYIFILVLAITSGLGFEKLQANSLGHKKNKIKYFFALAGLLCGIILLLMVLGQKELVQFLYEKGFACPNSNHLLVNLQNAQRFFFYLALFFLILRLGQEWSWPRLLSALLILFLAADLYGNMGFFGKEKTKDFFQKTKIMEIISADKGFYRTFTTPRTSSLESPLLIPDSSPLNFLKEKYLPSMFLLSPIHNIWGIEVLSLKRGDDLYKTLITSPSLTATNLVYLYGVKYVISTLPIEDKNFELIYAHLEGLPGKEEELIKDNTIKLYRLRNYLPRAWLVQKYRILPPKDILPALSNKIFQPSQLVFLEEEPAWAESLRKLKPHANFLSNKVDLLQEKNNQLILKVSCLQDSLLVLSDTYFPGWKALIRPLDAMGVSEKREFSAQIMRANYNFRALPLPAGEYEILFSYEPWSFKIGLLITLLSGGSIVIYCFLSLFKLRSGSGPPPGSPPPKWSSLAKL